MPPMIRTAVYLPSIALLFLAPCFAGAQEAVSASTSGSAGSAPLEPQRVRIVSPRLAAILEASKPKYAPPPAETEEPVHVPSEPDETIVLMSPVHVVGSKAEVKGADLAKKLQEKEDKVAMEPFNWKEGGTILQLGRVEVKLKYNPKHKGFDLLNLRW